MSLNRKYVTVRVDRDYFEKFFEPERKKINNILGINLSQTKFGAFLVNSGAKIKYPKINKIFLPPRRNRRFSIL